MNRQNQRVPLTTGVKTMRALFVVFCTLILPLALLAFGAARSGRSTELWVELSLLLDNWLYMIAPHLLAMLIATVVRPARQHFLPWSLMGLSLALVTFQCWVWWWVPPRESGLAWVLYIPLSAIGLISAGAIAWWQGRLTLPSKRENHGSA